MKLPRSSQSEFGVVWGLCKALTRHPASRPEMGHFANLPSDNRQGIASIEPARGRAGRKAHAADAAHQSPVSEPVGRDVFQSSGAPPASEQ